MTAPRFPRLTVVLLGFSVWLTPVWSADAPEPATLFQTANETDLSEFVWKNRPIVIFADSENDPAFIEQIELLRARPEALAERDVVVLSDTTPDTLSPLRKKLRPRGFMLVLIGKDGGIKLRKPRPWTVREITRVIDKMPMRQREIREAAEAGDS